MLKTANSAELVVKVREMLNIFYVLYYGDWRDPVLLISTQHRLARVKLSGILGTMVRVRWGRVPEGSVDVKSPSPGPIGPTKWIKSWQSPTLRYVKGELINRRLNYRIQGHLFTSHWITKMPIVLYYALQKTVKQVVRSDPAFCSCSQQDTNVEQHMFNISLAFATGSAEFAVSNIAPTISAIHIC